MKRPNTKMCFIKVPSCCFDFDYWLRFTNVDGGGLSLDGSERVL